MANNSKPDSIRAAVPPGPDLKFPTPATCDGRAPPNVSDSDKDKKLAERTIKGLRAKITAKDDKINSLKLENAKLRARLEQVGLSTEEDEWVVIDTKNQDKGVADVDKGMALHTIKGDDKCDDSLYVSAAEEQQIKESAKTATATRPSTSAAAGRRDLDLTKTTNMYGGLTEEKDIRQTFEYQRRAIQTKMLRAAYEADMARGRTAEGRPLVRGP